MNSFVTSCCWEKCHCGVTDIDLMMGGRVSICVYLSALYTIVCRSSSFVAYFFLYFLLALK